MVYLPLTILLIAAILCFGLGRAAPARLLGLLAATASLLAAGLLAFAPASSSATAPLELLVLGSASVRLSPELGAGERVLAIALLGSAGATLLALAGAIAAAVRGFGTLFAWSLLALAAALLSLASPPLSLTQPLAWAIVALAGYGALRASGATTSAAPPLGLTFGLVASSLLASVLVISGPQVATGALPSWPTALCGLLAALMLAGSPPTTFVRGDARAAPTPLGALVYGLVAPVTALSWLLRVTIVLPNLPANWTFTLGLIGTLGVLTCAAGALGERQLRALLSWTTAGQTAMVVAAVGLIGPMASVTGAGLLLSLMLAAALSAVAAATLERTTGSDDYTVGGVNPPRVAGLVWVVATVANLGLPPLWGFWPRLWLLIELQRQQPWLLGLLVAGVVLTSLALLAPLAKLLGPGGTTGRARASWGDSLPAVLLGVPLLVLGVAPGLVWQPWLQALPLAPTSLPISTNVQVVTLSAGVILLGLSLILGLTRSGRKIERDPDETTVRLAPDALGTALLPLAWLANPLPLMQQLWAGIQVFSKGLRFVMSFFEQRYYLLGMLAVLIMIMLLMAQ